MPFRQLLLTSVAVASLVLCGHAGDLKIPLPQRGKLTPVQKLNRDGVDAIRSHHYERAKTLFYKAYLYDPDDPFTLNNLGYVSELDGKLDSAERFYLLASQRGTDAIVDKASSPGIQGKPVKDVVAAAKDLPMQSGRENIEALRLLAKRRAPEAETLLQSALSNNSANAFTLNNMGVAKEMQGDFEDALKYYSTAAKSESSSRAVVTAESSWRGKPVTWVAAANAQRLRKQMQTEDSSAAKAARLNFRGVIAINRNDVNKAVQLFRNAYAADPDDAFSLNNMGYLAELDGDPETAQGYYDEAREAEQSNAHVGVATNHSAEGKKLSEIAEDSRGKVTAQLSAGHEAKRRQRSPIQLWGRDNKPVVEPAAPPSTNDNKQDSGDHPHQ